MIIFNFLQFLRDSDPGEIFILDGWQDTTTEGILVTRTGGTDNHYNGRIDYTIQFRSRSRDRNAAYEKLDFVYTTIRNRFGVPLPDTAVGTVLHKGAIAAIRPMQAPAYLGIEDQSGYHYYVFNILLTIGGNR